MRSQSAGNYNKLGTSETLRDEIVTLNEKLKPLSDHVPKHLKPLNDEQFGHYLAGLIDGDGHFSSAKQLVICFDELSVPLAYFLKKKIGFGHVRKVKNKKAYIYCVSCLKGLKIVLSLINNKIRTETKLNQIKNNILLMNENSDSFRLNKSDNLENHWLAGFSDADASFQIKILKRENRTEIRLNYRIDQKTNFLLLLIKNFLGGNIGYRSNQDTYYYGSTSFGSARKVIKYFDTYHLLSVKHLNYLKWRKAYLIIRNQEINFETKISKLKSTMNRLNEAQFKIKS